MEQLCAKYTVAYKDKEVGEAIVNRIGIRYELNAEITYISCAQPFRIAAVCGERCVPLGVMLPNNEGFSYHRILTKSCFRELGLEKLRGFTIMSGSKSEVTQKTDNTENEDSEWWTVEKPQELLEEGQFRRVFSACEGCLVSRCGEITYLAVPIIKGKVFPVMSVCCLGEVWKINGRLYMVFKILSGKLVF